MASDKRVRQQAIRRVIGTRPIRTQDVEATQATVSRDIEELGLVKVRGARGEHHYEVASRNTIVDAQQGPARLRRFCEDYAVEGAVSESLVVLRSTPGSANALAAAIDACALRHVIGTLAGDDTVFLATEGARWSRNVLEQLKEFGVGQQAKQHA